jgi:hypothetical protein
MKKFFYILPLLFVFKSNAIAQGAPPGGWAWQAGKQQYEVYASPIIRPFGEEDYYTTINGELVAGSPFLNNTWVNGKIVLADGRTFNNYKLKYNIYLQLVSFLNGKDSLDISDEIRSFYLYFPNDIIKQFVNIDSHKKQTNPQYFEVLIDDKKGQLLKSYSMLVSESNEESVIKKKVSKYLKSVVSYFYFDSEKNLLTKIKDDGNNIPAILHLSSTDKEKIITGIIDYKSESILLDLFNAYFALN